MLAAATLVLALIVMTAGAELFVRGASSIASRFGLSPLFIGLTVLAVGTSAPELAASVVGALGGSSDIAVGNVVGSNIFNGLAIVGVSAIICPLVTNYGAIRFSVWVACATATVPYAALCFDAPLPRAFGVSLVALFGVYTYAALVAGRREGTHAHDDFPVAAKQSPNPRDARTAGARVCSLAMIGAGLGLLVAGASGFVGSAVTFASRAGISDLTIALTVVAVGTSLPELVTSVVAAVRGKIDMAVGNVVGSNIFNSLGVLGICTVIEPQVVPPLVLRYDAVVMAIASFALIPVVRSGGRVSRLEGVILAGAYIVYASVLVAR